MRVEAQEWRERGKPNFRGEFHQANTLTLAVFHRVALESSRGV